MTMNVPFLDLKAQFKALENEIVPGLVEVARNAQFILGPPVGEFEKEFAAFLGVPHLVGVGSGTDAVALALKAAGVEAGDEVILPTNTFIATAEGVSMIGAKPVLADVDEKTQLLDPAWIEKACTPKTKAVIPVHLFGCPCDMDPILAQAKAKGLVVVEDAAQAHGASYRQRRCGSFGQAAAFSFYPGKNLGAYGEGGAVACATEDGAKRVKRLRDHGSEKKYEHSEIGFNSRLDTFQAVVLRAKLPHLDRWNALRRERAARYTEKLKGIPQVQTPYVPEDREAIFHLYVIQAERRDELMAFLRERGVGSLIHYPTPIHLQKAYVHLGYKEGDFPVAERVTKRIVSLPMFPELTDEMVDYVAQQIREFYR